VVNVVDGERLRNPIRVAVAMTVTALVRGHYESAARMTSGLSAEQLEQGVLQYGRTLVLPPESAWDEMVVYQQVETELPTMLLAFPLWTEEGVSDLMLDLRLIETYRGVVDVEILELRTEGGAERLTTPEVAAVFRVVRALVDHDTDYLRAIGAFAHGGDPYIWTRDYGPWDRVDLVMPPGEPRTWTMSVSRGVRPWVGVDVEMWTEQEGRSDLTLELEVTGESDESTRAVFRGLHVK
jgi:hypothetical protein